MHGLTAVQSDGASLAAEPTRYDALLVVAFGGPEGPQDVGPFLDNVLRGRRVPRERRAEVEAHYARFGGVSPINAQMRALVHAIASDLRAHDIQLPVVLGNRNWHPLLTDVIPTLADAGARRVLALFTSPYSSYSSCRQYWGDLKVAADAVPGDAAPIVTKLRAYFNHPLFVDAWTDQIRQAVAGLPNRIGRARVIFTAHSIPQAMADGCAYVNQLTEAARLVAEAADVDWELAYQSRSGSPHQPWLGPDVGERIAALPGAGVDAVVLAPLGFISDHMEVAYDLDIEAAKAAEASGLAFRRAATVSTHPSFLAMVRELVLERTAGLAPRSLGWMPPAPFGCEPDCCPAGA